MKWPAVPKSVWGVRCVHCSGLDLQESKARAQEHVKIHGSGARLIRFNFVQQKRPSR